MANLDRRRAQFAEVRGFVGGVYGGDLHAKRIDQLAAATLGVMQSASLAVAMIGQQDRGRERIVSPSLRTGLAGLPHPALRLVVLPA